jgi:hypothetical protein
MIGIKRANDGYNLIPLCGDVAVGAAVWIASIVDASASARRQNRKRVQRALQLSGPVSPILHGSGEGTFVGARIALHLRWFVKEKAI